MKSVMKRRFILNHYYRDLYNKLQGLRQGVVAPKTIGFELALHIISGPPRSFYDAPPLFASRPGPRPTRDLSFLMHIIILGALNEEKGTTERISAIFPA